MLSFYDFVGKDTTFFANAMNFAAKKVIIFFVTTIKQPSATVKRAFTEDNAIRYWSVTSKKIKTL